MALILIESWLMFAIPPTLETAQHQIRFLLWIHPVPKVLMSDTKEDRYLIRRYHKQSGELDFNFTTFSYLMLAVSEKNAHIF